MHFYRLKTNELSEANLALISGGFFDQTISTSVGGRIGRDARDRAYHRHLAKNDASNQRMLESQNKVLERGDKVRAREAELENFMSQMSECERIEFQAGLQLWLAQNANYDFSSIF